MKLLPLVLLTTGLFIGAPAVTLAEPSKVDTIIDLLHQAKDSSDPVPLLEKAHKELEGFKAAPNAEKEAAAGIGRKRVAGNAIAAGEHKKKALESIKEAIDIAKSGGDAKSKIEDAVAKVHEAGEMKH